MRKERQITNTEAIILLIIMIAIGGLVLYGKGGPSLSKDHISPINRLNKK